MPLSLAKGSTVLEVGDAVIEYIGFFLFFYFLLLFVSVFANHISSGKQQPCIHPLEYVLSLDTHTPLILFFLI